MAQLEPGTQPLLSEEALRKAGDSVATLSRLSTQIELLGEFDPALKQSLLTLIHSAAERAGQQEQVLAQTRANVEAWFNHAMERLSGWYKRKAQTLAFIIGVALALSLNIDSITLAAHLWREPAVRQALVANADEFLALNESLQPEDVEAASPAQAVEAFREQFAGLNLPLGWFGTPVESGRVRPGLHWCDPQNPAPPTGIGETAAERPSITAYGLEVHGLCYPVINAPLPQDSLGWLLKLLGLVISGAAAAQGAPFWFDVLKRLVNVRGTGSNPSEPAASSSRKA